MMRTALQMGELLGVALFGVLSAYAQSAAPQWAPVGPASVTMEALDIDPSNTDHLIAGTYFGGLYQSTDGGGTWSHIDSIFGAYPVFSVVFDRSQPAVVYAGTFQAGVYKSTDGGQTWTQSSVGLTDFNVQSLVIDPSNSAVLLAVTGTLVFRSQDSGAHWTTVTSGLKGVVGRSAAFNPVLTGMVYLGTIGQGVFVSSDHGKTWAPFNTGMSSSSIVALNFSDGGFPRLYAASSEGFGFELLPSATSWKQLTIWPPGPLGPVNQILPHPQTYGVLFASTAAGIYLSLDDGLSWSVSTSTPTGFIASDVFGTIFYAAGEKGGLVTTTNLGKTWTEQVQGMQNIFVGSLFSAPGSSGSQLFAATEFGIYKGGQALPAWSGPELGLSTFDITGPPNSPNVIFAGTENSGVWKSTDSGTTWAASYNGIVPERVYAIQASSTQPSVVFAGTSTGIFVSSNSAGTWQPLTSVTVPTVLSLAVDPQHSLTAYFGSLGGQIYKTTDAGASMLLVFQTADSNDNITQLKVSPNFSERVYAITASGYLLVTDNAGSTWNVSGPAVPIVSLDVNVVTPLKVYIGTVGKGVYKSTDGAISWSQAGSGISGTIYSVAVDRLTPTTVYAGTDGNIFRSLDEGATWTDVTKGLPSGPILTIVPDPFTAGTVYASIQSQGVYRSVDGGLSWHSITGSISVNGSVALAADPLLKSRLYAASYQHGVLVSGDNGNAWKPSNTGMTLFVRGLAFDSGDPQTMYAGTLLGGMFKSTDQGASWNSSGLGSKVILQVKTSPGQAGTVFTATTEGISRSQDGGTTWLDVGQKIGYVFSIATAPPGTVYVGGAAGAIYKSSDQGQTWTESDSGIPSGNVVSLVIDSATGSLYAAVQGASTPSIFSSSDGGASWQPTQVAPKAASNVTQLTLDGNAKALFAATNGFGVLVSFDGKAWASFNDGLTSSIVSAVVGSPTQAGTVYAATLNSGVFESVQGKSWSAVNSGLGSMVINGLAADPSNNGVLYAAAANGLYKTTNGAKTWNRIGTSLPQGGLVLVTVDPFNSNTLYVSTGKQLFKSLDGGGSWKEADTNLAGAPIQAVQVGANSSIVFAGTLGQGFSVSTDGAQTWSGSAAPATINPFALCVAINPQNPSIVYAGTSAGVIKSSDGGDTWVALPTGLTTSAVIALIIDPNTPSVMYAGTSGGVFMTTNGGENWTSILAGMFQDNVTSLAVDANNSKIVYAGTEGGGVFRYVRQ